MTYCIKKCAWKSNPGDNVAFSLQSQRQITYNGNSIDDEHTSGGKEGHAVTLLFNNATLAIYRLVNAPNCLNNE